MPPRSSLTRSLDTYAAHRCVTCRHLRYKGQQPGDACMAPRCGCTQHVLPAERDQAADGAR